MIDSAERNPDRTGRHGRNCAFVELVHLVENVGIRHDIQLSCNGNNRRTEVDFAT